MSLTHTKVTVSSAAAGDISAAVAAVAFGAGGAGGADGEDPHVDASACKHVNALLARVGDKWSMLVVRLLRKGPRRFNEIKRLTGGISQRMLTLTLRGLERDGMVTRTAFPVIPPRVDYELTPLGHSLSEPIEALGRWAVANVPTIDAARIAFDLRNPRAVVDANDDSDDSDGSDEIAVAE